MKMEYFNKCKKEFGSVTENGIEYAICDNAQVENFGTDGEVRYYATGISFEQLQKADNSQDVDFLFDPHVKIEWEIIPEYLNSDDTDESNACDWGNPINIEIVG